MIVTLTNFMCYKNKTIHFNDKGLQLLKGLNGAGKSTILKAVYFALYGSLKKVQSYSGGDVKVELEIGEYKITRTKNPNRLIVEWDGEIYEDESAQPIINEFLGMSNEQYCISSYIRPNSRRSVVTLPPADQLRMIESFTFTDDLHIKHKQEIAKLIKERKERLNILVNKVDNSKELYHMELEELEQLEEMDEPEVLDEDEIISLNEQIEECTNEIGKTKKQLNILENDDELEKLNKRIIKLKNDILVVDAQIENLQITNIDESEIERLEELQKSVLLRKNVEKNYKEFENLKNSYFDELREQINEVENFILSKKELSEIESQIQKYQRWKTQYDMYQTKLKEWGKDDDPREALQKLNKHMHLIDKKYIQNKQNTEYNKHLEKIHKCPHCEKDVFITNNGLKIGESGEPKKVLSDEGLAKLDKLKKNTESELKLVNEICLLKVDDEFESIDELKETYEKHSTNVVRYNSLVRNLKNGVLSSTLIKMQKGIRLDILTKEPEIQTFEYDNNPYQISTLDDFLTNLKSEFLTQTKNKLEYSTLMRSKENMENECKKIQKRIDVISPLDKEQVMNNLLDLQTTLQTMMDRREELNKLSVLWDEWSRYVKQKEKVERFKVAHENFEKERWKVNSMYESALKLEKIHKDAEILAIESVVNTINEFACEYLDLFFEDDIIVRCDLIKKTQKGEKFKVNTYINYKGHEYATPDDLSQGELVRINLAFILALNKYFDAKFLMLDEFLENLDSEIIIDITRKLRDLAENKPILVIDHTAPEGMYDNVLTF